MNRQVMGIQIGATTAPGELGAVAAEADEELARLKAAVDGEGRLTGMTMRVSAPSILTSLGMKAADGHDPVAVSTFARRCRHALAHTITHISAGSESPRAGHGRPHLLKCSPITTDGVGADGRRDSEQAVRTTV